MQQDRQFFGSPSPVGMLPGGVSEELWSCVKVTPLPAGGGCYRSRIYTAQNGINPLVAACDQLLNLVITAPHFDYPEDHERFLQDLAHEIRAFEHRAQIANYSPWNIVIARYILCCLLDEVIAQSEWGQNKKWLEKNLCSVFYNPNFEITRFLAVVEQALGDVTHNLHLLELVYLCLVFGFTGKYQGAAGQAQNLAALRERLYQIIIHQNSPRQKQRDILVRANVDQATAPKESMADKAHPTLKFASRNLWWIAVSILGMIGVLLFIGLNFKLRILSQPLYTSIEQIAKEKAGGRI